MTAVVAGTFSFAEASLEFVLSVVGGVLIGLAVGWVVALIRVRLDNIPAEITIALLTGYLAYIPAQALHVSGVLAAVTVGVYLGWRAPELSTPQMRMEGRAVFTTLVFLLNALLFTLVGLQLRPIVDELRGQSGWELVGEALAVVTTVITVRILWVWVVGRGSRRHRAVVAWMGMRGAVSLAAALALPLETDAGLPFPGRELIIFLAFAVILGTLVVQGLTLPALIERLGLEDDGIELKEDTKARILAAEAALQRLEELVEEDWVREDTAERMRGALQLPPLAVRRALRRRGRRRDRGAVDELPAPEAGAARGRAPGDRLSPPPGTDQRRRHARRRARPRPRRPAPGRLSCCGFSAAGSAKAADVAALAVGDARRMDSMWAIRKPRSEPGLVLDEVPVPLPGDDEVLVRVEAASVCGTDLHIFRWDEWSQHRIVPPLTLGHEFAGTVVEIGRNVRHVGGRGLRVGGEPRHLRRLLPLPDRATPTCASGRRSSASTATAPSPSTSPSPSR